MKQRKQTKNFKTSNLQMMLYFKFWSLVNNFVYIDS